jgi:3-oxoacyl-(acyl-carrier-protein) synthase
MYRLERMDSPIPHCIIRNNKIWKNDEMIFEKKSVSLNDFMAEAYSFLKIDYPKFYKMDRLSKLGFIASEILLREVKDKTPTDIALVLSNSNSSLDTDLRYWDSVKTLPSPSLFVYTLPNIVAGEICIRHGIKGENLFFVSAQFDAVWITSYVNMLLKSGKAKYCLAGWVDVLDDRSDVFIYLTDREIVASQILELYQHGTVNG